MWVFVMVLPIGNWNRHAEEEDGAPMLENEEDLERRSGLLVWGCWNSEDEIKAVVPLHSHSAPC